MRGQYYAVVAATFAIMAFLSGSPLRTNAAQKDVIQRRSGSLTATVVNTNNGTVRPLGSLLKVYEGGALVFERTYDDRRGDVVGIVPFPGAKRPVVIFSLFSGGAHCCFQYVSVSPGSMAGDTTFNVANFGSFPPSIVRVGDDRHWALQGKITTEYIFGSFAPLAYVTQILDYADGRFADTTARYPDVLRNDEQRLVGQLNVTREDLPADYRLAEERVVLAAYVAATTRSGHADAGWQRARELLPASAYSYSSFQTTVQAWLDNNGLAADPQPTPDPTLAPTSSPEPCGSVEFIPIDSQRVDPANGRVSEAIEIRVAFRDGTSQSQPLDYPFVYPSANDDPFTNRQAPNPVFQFPPPSLASREPDLVQYVMRHTTPGGFTQLKSCASK